jgi:hypothetical protein
MLGALLGREFIANWVLPAFKALDLLHSCSQGHGESIRRFNRLFAATLALREEIAYRAHQREEVVEQPRQNFRVAWDQAARERSAREAGLAPGDRRLPEQPKPAESILDRPRLHVSGRRRIPRFVNARGVPFLRIKKPIPASLSRVIRQKLKRKQDRVNRRVILDNLLLIAEMEDDWDLRTGQAEKNSTWTSAVEESVSALEEAIEETNQKDYVMAQRMWNVVLKEMELAEQERQERERQTGQR